MRTRSGCAGTLHHPPLVGADADRAVALADLDVEAPLALVDDLAQRRARHAPRALEGARDVLDADLEADRRLAVGELLEREHRGSALHHPDHPGGREDLDGDRAADVGEQPALDGELLLARHAMLIPPETLIVWPVTKDASSEARNAIAAATSSGSPMRCSSVPLIIPCFSRAP